jgi:hypothetical protein
MDYYIADIDKESYLALQQQTGDVTDLLILLSIIYGGKKHEDRINLILFFKDELAKGNIRGLVIDSGTYSLNMSGETPEEHHFLEYVQFLLQYGHLVTFYLAFDADFNATKEAVKHNRMWLNRMEQSGLTPVPVVHHPDYYGEEPRVYLEGDYPRIAFGSVTDKKKRDKEEEPDKEEERAHIVNYWLPTVINNHGRKCHLLGVGSEKELVRNPIHSADSTTWKFDVFKKGIVRFKPNADDGLILQIPVNRYEHDSVKRKSFTQLPSGVQEQFEAYLGDTFGMSLDQFFEPANGNPRVAGINAYVVSMHYYIHTFPHHIDLHHRKNGWDTSWT